MSFTMLHALIETLLNNLKTSYSDTHRYKNGLVQYHVVSKSYPTRHLALLLALPAPTNIDYNHRQLNSRLAYQVEFVCLLLESGLSFVARWLNSITCLLCNISFSGQYDD